mgnify:CR=1 FL=1|jgi:glutaredoxin
MTHLRLLYFPGCPFCHKVLDVIESQKREDVDLVNTQTDPGATEYLLEKTGKTQVPCLFIDDEPLLESQDIIDFLRKELPGKDS